MSLFFLVRLSFLHVIYTPPTVVWFLVQKLFVFYISNYFFFYYYWWYCTAMVFSPPL